MAKADDTFLTFTRRGKLVHLLEGAQYSSIGTCGMKKDEKVIGALESINPRWDSAILVDDRGIPCEVALKVIQKV